MLNNSSLDHMVFLLFVAGYGDAWLKGKLRMYLGAFLLSAIYQKSKITFCCPFKIVFITWWLVLLIAILCQRFCLQVPALHGAGFHPWHKIITSRKVSKCRHWKSGYFSFFQTKCLPSSSSFLPSAFSASVLNQLNLLETFINEKSSFRTESHPE